MTRDLSLHELVAMQSCQDPREFKGLDALDAGIESDPHDPDSMILSVHQNPNKITAGNQMHRLRKALGDYGFLHPDALQMLDATPPSHFKPAGPEADHAIVRAKASVAAELALLFTHERIQVDLDLVR